MAHDPKLNLHQRLLAVFKEVNYVRKDVVVSGAKGVARDAVVSEIRIPLIENGIIAVTSQVCGRFIETTQKSSSGTPLTIYVGTYRTTFINVDVPSETLIVEHEAQGNDYGDKAPGKAATYAEKLNFVKGLMLETGIAEESRHPGEGDDDNKGGGDASGEEKPGAVKTPQRKSAPKAAASEDKGAASSEVASEALIKQIVATVEATGQGERLAAYLAKVDKPMAELTVGQAKFLWAALNKTEGE